MIEVSLAYDKKFNSLSDFAALLYLKILPHTDDFGRFDGDPEVIRARVEPMKGRKSTHYLAALEEIDHAGLITIYELSNGRRFIQYNQSSFERINAFLIKQRKKGEFPPPPGI